MRASVVVGMRPRAEGEMEAEGSEWDVDGVERADLERVAWGH